MTIIVRQGSTGSVVYKLQEWLNWWAEVQPKLRVDGIFGPQTARALNQVRASRGLSQTGVFDASVFALGDPNHPATGNLAAAIRSAESLTEQQRRQWGYTQGGGSQPPASITPTPNAAASGYTGDAAAAAAALKKKKEQEQLMVVGGFGLMLVILIISSR